MARINLKGLYFDDGDNTLHALDEAGNYFTLSIGGGGVTIYTGDGSLTEDRTVESADHVLVVQNGDDNQMLYLDAASGRSLLSMVTSDLSNGSSVLCRAQDIQGYFEFDSFFGDSKEAHIKGYANVDESEIEYDADSHNFVGTLKSGDVPAVSGTFTSQDGKTITVTNGLITGIV